MVVALLMLSAFDVTRAGGKWAVHLLIRMKRGKNEFRRGTLFAYDP
jgi:hypothetical protein